MYYNSECAQACQCIFFFYYTYGYCRDTAGSLKQHCKEAQRIKKYI